MSRIRLTQAKRVLAEEYARILKDLGPNQLRKLQDWKLVIDSRPKSRLGQCRWVEREIGISSWLLELNDPLHAETVDTLRHEVAHVLAGPGEGHGAVWRRFALAVKARPRALCNTKKCGLVTPKDISRIQGTCRNCGKKFGRLRRPTKLLCCLECRKKFMVLGASKADAFRKSFISWVGCPSLLSQLTSTEKRGSFSV